MKLVRFFKSTDALRWIFDVFMCAMVAQEAGVFTTIMICLFTIHAEAQTILNRANTVFTVGVGQAFDKLGAAIDAGRTNQARERPSVH